MTYIKLGWVRAKILVKHKGFSEDALNKMRANGKLREGEHWIKNLGVVLYNYEAIDEYLCDV